MRKGLVVLASLMLLGLLVGCMDHRYTQRFLSADSLLRCDKATEALALLDDLRDSVGTLPRGKRMRYELLLLRAQNSSGIPFTSDSMAKELVSYYERHGSANEAMQAHYLLGRAYYDLEEVPLAVRYFHTAIDYADTTRSDCDFHTLSRIHGQLARLFLEQEAPRNALEEMDIAERMAWRCHDTLMALSAFSKRADAYDALNMRDSAIYIKQVASEKYRRHGNIQLSARTLGPIIDFVIERKEYNLAKDYMDLYEKYSGLFDSQGNISKGYDMYYYIKSLYYLGIHCIDSAEYFARRILISHKISDLEGAYKALYFVFKEKNMKDSLAKYAMLAYNANDSAYRELSTETYQRMHALYNYNHSQQLAEKKEREAESFKFGLVVAILVVLLLITCLITAIHLYKRTQDRQQLLIGEFALLQQERIALEQLVSKNNEEYAIEIEEKRATIAAMENALQKYEQNRVLRDLTAIDEALRSDDITRIFLEKAKKGIVPSFSEWTMVKKLINQKLPSFIPTLKTQYPSINESELELCILIRLHFTTSQIAVLLCRAESTVSKTKERLLHKMFPEVLGGAKEFERRLLETI